MPRRDPHQSRRTFLRASATLAAGLTGGFAGCSAIPGLDDEDPNPPDYDERAAEAVVRESFPRPPAVFPIEIPESRFRAHETRARELLDAVPAKPDIPNEAIAKQIATHRTALADSLGDMERTHTPRDRLDRWRYYRDHAAEIWGSYAAATNKYTADDFQTRYEQLRAAYNAFESEWTYGGSNLTEALVVHQAVEELVSSGLDDVLTTGPFPSDPESAVFEAGRMVQAHERAAAKLGDARTFLDRFLADETRPTSHRLTFADATERLRHSFEIEAHREPYNRALERGRSELDADVGDGPAAHAFDEARQYAKGAEHSLRQARDRNDPATAAIQAARYRHGRRTFGAVVDAIYAEDIVWPDDVTGLRQLRENTIQALETAWNTEPRHLSVVLTAHATGALRFLSPHRDQEDVDERDLAAFVGTLHYATRYVSGIPDLTQTVVDAITTS